MKIFLVAAARPNFMKIAPLYHQLIKYENFDTKIIHTGQHYDKNMSDDFFYELMLPSPHFYLNVGSGTQSEQVGNTMIKFENILFKEKPNLVVVVGDVNATMACSIVAKKLNIQVAHLEAGIRSFDMSMPEEINRKVTDAICDYYWTPSIDANENLVKEGVDRNKIKFVGNIMIDSFELLKDKIYKDNIKKELSIDDKDYCILTLHRPSNVDSEEMLKNILNTIKKITKKIQVIFPIHPRTKKNILNFGLNHFFEEKNLICLEPLSYIKFMNLLLGAKLVITDSGGVQEETTYLGVPCLTLRENTERPITVLEGTNTLVKLEELLYYLELILKGKYKKGSIPLLWDGKTAIRVTEEIIKISRNF